MHTCNWPMYVSVSTKTCNKIMQNIDLQSNFNSLEGKLHVDASTLTKRAVIIIIVTR